MPEPPEPPSTTSTSSSSDGVIVVNVKTLDDRETRVQVRPTETVEDLLSVARPQLNLTGSAQRIIFQGRVLTSNQTIESIGIQNGQTVHLVERGPESVNDNPTVAPAGNHHFEIARRRMAMAARAQMPAVPPPPPPPDDQLMTVEVPPIRVPASIASIPLLSSRISEDVIIQDVRRIGTRPSAVVPTVTDHIHQISWSFRIIDDVIFRPRENLERIIKEEIIAKIPFLPENCKSDVRLKWNSRFNQLSIEFPQIPSHVASPALEKLDFLCLWTENLTRFNDKMEETDGLLAAVAQVLEMTNRRQTDDGLDEPQRYFRVEALNAIIRDLEMLSTEITFMKDFERQRFRDNRSDQYRSLKIEECDASVHNPPFLMRHALDIDAHHVHREFRRQRVRFARLEDMMDDLNEAGAVRFIRDAMLDAVDYRYQALSMFYNYVQRMRHQIAHITHLTSELDVSFMTPSCPQRLLPHYATNVLAVPQPHQFAIILKFKKTPREETALVPITAIIEPPRLLADVAATENWPYLSYFPPSVHLDALLAPPRTRALPAAVQAPAPQAPADPEIEVISEMIATPAQLMSMIMDPARIRMATGRATVVAVGPGGQRRIITAGDAPSVPVETLPPPTSRFSADPNARGPETETLQPLPVQIEPTELQRIARNIASRYRPEALERIASRLSDNFRREMWDTRIQNMPVCTLRQCVSIALELLTSAGGTAQESRDLMLALVHDESVLVRAIAECVKSLFGRGEFPTHVARIISPRNEAAGARVDYESPDHVDEAQSDELDGMVVRVPTDVSQPQSGDLRELRELRAARREQRAARQAGNSGLASIAPAYQPNRFGPSFNQQDEAAIRAGRLPGTSSLGQRIRRATNAEATITMTLTAQPIAISQADVPDPIPVRQVVSPTPTTRGLFEEDVNEPTPPAPTPRSAPATVASSPSREGSGSRSPEVPEPPEDNTPERQAARQAARLARARIDNLAAVFNGNLADAQSITPLVGEMSSTPLTDPRRRVRAEPGARSNRPMVSIDPFMQCANRNCEVNRLQNPATLANGARFTLQSLQPDPEFVDGTLLQANGHPVERRPVRVDASKDDDYNYSVRRSAAGDLEFSDIPKFAKFLRTMIRSGLAHCIDADSIVTMNLNNISGYRGSDPTDLFEMLKTHLASSDSSRVSTAPTPPESSRPDTRRHHTPGSAPPVDIDAVATSFSQLVDYMQHSGNPRPPGIFGFLMELTYSRLTGEHFRRLVDRNEGFGVAMEFESSIRSHVRHNYLGGRTGLSPTELHSIAETVVNRIEFFENFLRDNAQLPAEFLIGTAARNATVRADWALRITEIAFVKSILAISQMENDSASVCRQFIESVDSYLYRNHLIFWILSNREGHRHHNNIHRIADFFANIRFENNSSSTNRPQFNRFIEDWNRIINFWTECPMVDLNEHKLTEFLMAARLGNDWIDVENPNSPPPRTQHSQNPTTSSTTTSSTASTTSLTESTTSTVATANNSRSRLRLMRDQIWRFVFQENGTTTRLLTTLLRGLTWWRRRLP